MLKKRVRKFHTKTQVAVYAIGASLLSLLLYWVGPEPLEELDQRGQDFVFKLRESPPPPPEVAVVTVDEKSIKRYGRWPWSRTIQADLIRRLKELGAGTIALDIIYLLPESEQADKALAEALEAPGAPVVGGYFFRDQQTLGGDELALQRLREERIKLILRSSSDSHLDNIITFPYVETNQNDLAIHFNGLGFFNAIHDRDGLVRSVPLVLRYGEDYYPSLMLKGLSEYTGLQIGLTSSLEGLAGIRLGGVSIPVDVTGRLAVNFYNGRETIPLLSASDILDGTIGPEQIQDRLIFIGVTEYGIADLRPTPVHDSFPGVMLHATAAANILQGFYLVRDNRIILINVAMMGTVPLVMVLILTRIRKPIMMAGVFVGIVAGGCLVFYWLVAKLGFLVSFVYPTLAIALGFSVFVTYYILTSQRKNRFLTKAFSSYVSPAVVEQLLADPERLTLAGEKREVTVFFSDIRGFTTISESMAPEQLAEMLNVYLDAMVEIIMAQQGTLDKYIGDAIMALYNAPLYLNKHPDYAAESSLLMILKLAELNQQFEQNYGRQLTIGIGLHTGPAIVGNLGGARRFEYTAIGDTVNLAARLESATKLYGVVIIISEATRRRLDQRFLCRRLDRIRVVGKKEAVDIYELMSYVGNSEKERLAQRYESALEAYFANNFEQAVQICYAILKDFLGDTPTKILLERCRSFLESPPPVDWGGVYVATKK